MAAISVMLLVGLMAAPTFAASAKTIKVDVLPLQATASSTTVFSVRVTNTSPGTSNPNSFTVTVPSTPMGFQVTGVVIDPTAGKNSNPNLSAHANVVSPTTVSATGLDPVKTGQFVTLDITVTTPAISCPTTSTSSSAWTAVAWTGTNLTGQPLQVPTPSASTGLNTLLTRTCIGPPASIVFTQQPSQQAVPTVAGQVMDPVTVKIADGQANPVPSVKVFVEIGANPGTATTFEVSGNTDANGNVTFSGLVIDKSSSGYTLKACVANSGASTNCSDATISSLSDAFMISSITATDCLLGVGCQKTVGDPNAVNAPGDQAVAVTVPAITGSTDTGTLVVTVEGDPSAFPSCGLGFSAPVVTIVPPPGYSAGNPISVTFYNYLSSVNVGLRPVCKIVDLVGGGTTTTVLGSCSANPVPCIQSESYDTLTGRLATTVLGTSTDPHLRATP